MTKVPQISDWEATNGLKWDAWNRLVEVTDGDATVAEYRYDGLRRRSSKATDATRHYYYNDRWQIMEERMDDAAAADRQFVWGQRYMDDLVLRDRDTNANGTLDERLYVLHDYFNPAAVAAPDGTVLERYGYDAFGLSRVMTPTFNPRSSSNYDWETRYGAYRWDGETGFYQVRYRYLHPTLGRWLSRDPIGEIGGVNIYVYVFNSSNNTVDWLGLAKECTLGEKKDAKCSITVTSSGTTPDIEVAAKQLISLADQTDTFFEILGFVESGLTAGRTLVEILSALAIEQGKSQLSPDVEEMAKMAFSLLKNLGDRQGYSPHTRIEYQECVCGFFSFNKNKWKDKVDPWKAVPGAGELGRNTYLSRVSAIKAGAKACETELEEWNEKNTKQKEEKPVE